MCSRGVLKQPLTGGFSRISEPSTVWDLFVVSGTCGVVTFRPLSGGWFDAT